MLLLKSLSFFSLRLDALLRREPRHFAQLMDTVTVVCDLMSFFGRTMSDNLLWWDARMYVRALESLFDQALHSWDPDRDSAEDDVLDGLRRSVCADHPLNIPQDLLDSLSQDLRKVILIKGEFELVLVVQQ